MKKFKPIVLLWVALSATAPALCHEDVVSVHELEDFMIENYPVTTAGYVNVTTFPPSVEHIENNRVRFTFESNVSAGGGNVSYHGVVSSIEGELARSRNVLLFKKIYDIDIDASNVNYEFQPSVERALHMMLITHYVSDPILRIVNDIDHKRFIPGFRLRTVKVAHYED